MTANRTANLFHRIRSEGAESDAELLARFARARDAAAFAALVHRHGPLVLGICRRTTGHAHDAEDAFQAVFLVLAQKAGQLNDPRLLSSWLYGVALRVAKKAKRRAARRREETGAAMPERSVAPVEIENDLGPVVDEELAALPEHYRQAVLACDLELLTRTEAAARLGIPEGTLHSRLSAGRKRLAERLTRRGIALALPAFASTAVAGVPEALVQNTLETVMRWAAGGPVARPVAELAREGLTMLRKLMVLGTGILAAAAVGVGLANDPPKPEKKVERVPAEVKPEAKPEPVAVRYGVPKLKRSVELMIESADSLEWTPDGKWIAIHGRGSYPISDKNRNLTYHSIRGMFFYKASLPTIKIDGSSDSFTFPETAIPIARRGERSLALTSDGRSVIMHSGVAGRINTPMQVALIPVFDKDYRLLVPHPANADHPEPVATATFEPEFGRALGYTRDGKYLATYETGEGDKKTDVKIVLRDPRTGEPRETVFDERDTKTAVAIGDDYTHFYRWIGTDREQRGVEILIRGDRPVRWTVTPPKENPSMQVQFTPDRQKVIVVFHKIYRRPLAGERLTGAQDAASTATGANCTVATYEAATGRELHRITMTLHPIGRIQLSPDGRLLAAHAMAMPVPRGPGMEAVSQSLVVVDLVDGTVLKKWQLEPSGPGQKRSVLFAFSPTEPKLYIVEPQDTNDASGASKHSTVLGIWEFPTAASKGQP